MKIVIGIDREGLYKPAVNLAARLRLPSPQYFAVHVAEHLGTSAAVSAGAGPQLLGIVQSAERAVVDEAVDYACSRGLYAEPVLLAGQAAIALMRYADDVDADLVCVQSHRKGRFGSMFLGSVSRGLAIGAHQCALISKGDCAPGGALSAVWATDHSPYAKRALARLIELAPKGLARVHVLTAAQVHPGDGLANRAEVDSAIADEQLAALEAQVSEDVETLCHAGIHATGEVRGQSVAEAIRDAMAEQKADLLLMGAQGHGFMHRLVLGSNALHQVLVEPYSVLILRPRSERTPDET